jgi:hypothetical protein
MARTGRAKASNGVANVMNTKVPKVLRKFVEKLRKAKGNPRSTC